MAAELEREVIALAARGLVVLELAARVPSEAFTSAARLLAWVCACRVLRGCAIAWPKVADALGPKGLGLDAGELLARCPAAIRDVVAARIAKPVHETIETARAEVVGLGAQLQRMRLRRPVAARPFLQVRLMLVSMPRLDLPLEVWRELQAETQGELDACERIDTLDPAAVDRLLGESSL